MHTCVYLCVYVYPRVRSCIVRYVFLKVYFLYFKIFELFHFSTVLNFFEFKPNLAFSLALQSLSKFFITSTNYFAFVESENVIIIQISLISNKSLAVF